MPPRPTLANTVRIQVVYAGINGTKANNILYALMGSGWNPTVANLNQLALNIRTPWATMWNPIGGTGWSLQDIWTYDNGGTTENVGNNHIGTGGTGGAPVLPPNCAAVISWQIPAHYRGGHPRTYLPGIPEGNLTAPGSNAWSTTFRSVLAAAAGAFLSSVNSTLIGAVGTALGTIAYKRFGVPLTVPAFEPYTGGVIHGRVDSQRRRLGNERLFP